MNKSAQKSRSARWLSVVSGKGGVGKSILAYNLAERLAAQGRRVLLVDADLACPNQHILANADPTCGLLDFAAGSLSLAEAVTPLAEHLSLLAGLGSSGQVTESDSAALSQTLSRLEDDANHFDLVIFDLPSGASVETLSLVAESDRAVIVMVPELTSISDAFGLYKQLAAKHLADRARIVINGANDIAEVEELHGKFTQITDRFVGSSPQFWGWLPADEAVRQSLAAQRPIAAQQPDSPVAEAIGSLAQRVMSELALPPDKSDTNQSPKTKDLLATADIED